MTHSIRFLSLALASAVLATSAAAHDPKEHAKERAAAEAKANCTAMKDMDMSKMDPNDPVALAMHKKCAAAEATDADHHDGHAHTHAAAPTAAAPKPDDHGVH